MLAPSQRSAAISGIAANAKAILGGDMEVRLTHRAATPKELADMLARETPVWAELIVQSGAKVE